MRCASGWTSPGWSSTWPRPSAGSAWKEKAVALSKNQMVPHPDLNAIAAFIDRRLSEAGRTEIVTHLAGCAECRALIAAHARGQVAPDGQGQASAGPRRSAA